MLNYGDRLLSKIKESLEHDQICDTELISVYQQCDEASDIQVTASAVLILKEVDISDIDAESRSPRAINFTDDVNTSRERTNLTVENDQRSSDDAATSNRYTSKGTPLQLWRYVNGGPMLDYDDAYTCSLSNAIRTFNWGVCGHTIKRSDVEKRMSEDIVLRTPSWILLSKRHENETFVYAERSSTANVRRDATEIDSFCNHSTSEERIRSSEAKYSADGSRDSHDISDHLVATRKRQKVSDTEDLSDDAVTLQQSAAEKRRQVELCQMIVLFDVNMSHGKPPEYCVQDNE